MPAKLTTTVNNIEIKVANITNRNLITEFYNYLTNIDTSENYQNGLLKVIIRYAEHLGPNVTFNKMKDKKEIMKFLDLKKKIEGEDPDKKRIRT